MKKYLDGVLVVEGKEDASYLSNYIESEIVTVQGYEISQSTIAYLEHKKVIILTDPDEAGKKIRERLNNYLKNAINVEIDLKQCTRASKNGVAECRIEEIMSKLEPYFTQKPRKTPIFNSFILYDLGISNNKELRTYIGERLSLGSCNNKQLLKRLNDSNIQLEQLKEIIEEYRYGN